MPLTIGPNRFAIAATILCLFIFSSCGTGSEKTDAAKGAGANASPGNSPPAGRVPPSASSAPTENLPASEGSNQTAKSDKRRNEPQPQIGPGGNDFFLFTKTRSVLDADPDLKTANIIVDVKGGILTLDGKVPNAALKMKAEQLVRAVEGVKEVRNQLRISP